MFAVSEGAGMKRAPNQHSMTENATEKSAETKDTEQQLASEQVLTGGRGYAF
jgi:hypothetical protein